MSLRIADTDLMHDHVTYWGPPTNDGYGASVFPAPVEIRARWDGKGGVEPGSAALVFPDQDIEREGWVYLGVTNEPDPREVEGARKVILVREVRDQTGTERQIRAWL